MPTISLSFRTEESKRKRLDQIAERLDRNRNWLINEAIENYLELYEWQIEHIEQSIRRSDAGGRTYSTDEVRAHFAKREAQRHKKASK
jgi:predicted transcriptional regulator